MIDWLVMYVLTNKRVCVFGLCVRPGHSCEGDISYNGQAVIFLVRLVI